MKQALELVFFLKPDLVNKHVLIMFCVKAKQFKIENILTISSYSSLYIDIFMDFMYKTKIKLGGYSCKQQNAFTVYLLNIFFMNSIINVINIDALQYSEHKYREVI